MPFPAAPQGTRFCCVTLGDLDGNGTLDVFAIRESPSKGYRCSNRSNGFFDVFTEVSLGITHPWAVEICDTNEDGRLDLVVAGDGPDGSCVVLQDSFTPLKFSPPQVLSLQRGVRVATGDVNGDGFLDVVTSGEEGVAVALQSTDVRGRFLPSYSLSNVACGGLAVGDFDRDGQPEVCFLDINAGTLDFTEGDPDFDLLGVIPLNGLPPGLPVRGYTVAATQSIGDPDFDLLVCSPRSGSTTGTIRMMGTTP